MLPDMLEILLCNPCALMPFYFLKGTQLLEIFVEILTFLVNFVFGAFLKTVNF